MGSKHKRRIDTDLGAPMTAKENQVALLWGQIMMVSLEEFRRMCPGYDIWINDAFILTPDGEELMFDAQPSPKKRHA